MLNDSKSRIELIITIGHSKDPQNLKEKEKALINEMNYENFGNLLNENSEKIGSIILSNCYSAFYLEKLVKEKHFSFNVPIICYESKTLQLVFFQKIIRLGLLFFFNVSCEGRDENCDLFIKGFKKEYKNKKNMIHLLFKKYKEWNEKGKLLFPCKKF